MISFKNNIYKLTRKTPDQTGLTPSGILVENDFQEEGDGGCVSCATLSVQIPINTTKRVEFTLSGDNGTYSSGLNLCMAGDENIAVDTTEVLTSNKTYRFGIDATKSSINGFSNTITVRLYDNTTNSLEDTYVTTRTHTNVNC